MSAFQYSIGLTSIICEATIPPVCGAECFTNVNKTLCTLYVPAESVEAYKIADQWKDFYNIEPDPTRVNGISAEKEKNPVSYFDFGGREIPAPQKGTNIVRYADGTTQKIVVK